MRDPVRAYLCDTVAGPITIELRAPTIASGRRLLRFLGFTYVRMTVPTHRRAAASDEETKQ